MNQSDPTRRFAVLFVDDEQQALKYFSKAFSKDFRVLTAPRAEEAREILEREGDSIGVVVSDQRMPGMQGVELLTEVRRRRPGIVRILTTAYSELDNAIEAVNSGAVFRYVTKPWDLRDLRGVLLRAMDFFEIQRERDILLREKLSVLQRMIVLDRVRSFTVLAAALAYRMRNSMTALKAFLDVAPVHAGEPTADNLDWGDLWTLAQDESGHLVEAVDEVLASTMESEYAFAARIDTAELLRREAASASEGDGGFTVEADVRDELPPLKADARLVERVLRVLLRRMAETSGPGGRATLGATRAEAVAGAPGVRITLRGDGPAWNADQLGRLFSALRPGGEAQGEGGADMLTAFFIAHHHGGDLRIHPAPPQGPGFELLLPLDPEAAQPPQLGADWLERIFTNLEAWDLERDY